MPLLNSLCWVYSTISGSDFTSTLRVSEILFWLGLPLAFFERKLRGRGRLRAVPLVELA